MSNQTTQKLTAECQWPEDNQYGYNGAKGQPRAEKGPADLHEGDSLVHAQAVLGECRQTARPQLHPVQLTYVPCQQHKAHSPHQYSLLMSHVNNTTQSPHQYSSLMSPANNTKHTVLTSTAHLCPMSTTQSTQSSLIQLAYVPWQQHKADININKYKTDMSPARSRRPSSSVQEENKECRWLYSSTK